jgi:hypothetical protein
VVRRVPSGRVAPAFCSLASSPAEAHAEAACAVTRRWRAEGAPLKSVREVLTRQWASSAVH